MFKLLKNYWDIIFGALAGILFGFIAKLEIEKIQLYYSIIILILVCIGVFRVLKQEIEKRGKKKERKHNVIDSVVDSQKSIKAISLAQQPTKEGEKVGNLILIFWGGIKKPMEKLKTFFNKFKGYMLTIALAILTLVEMCGGFINQLCGGVFTINGVAVLPVVTLACTAVVGIISNGFTKEQQEKIKALFSKSSTNELVLAEIKKTIKEKTTQLAQFNKVLTTQTHEKENLESELETLNNTLQAKKEMFAMTPRLADEADVQLATNAVVDCQAKIENKKAEMAETQKMIDTLTTTINALKSQI